MELLTVSTDQWNAWISQFFLPLTRILGMLATAPVIGQTPVPIQTRLGLGVALTLVIAPLLTPSEASVSLASLTGAWLLIQQLMVGLILGFMVNLIFAAVTMAGEFAGLQMGLGFASFYDPVHAAFQPVVAQFLNILFSLIFITLDGHLQVIHALVETFHQIPIDPVMQLHAQGWQTGLMWAVSLFVDSLRLSLPVLTAMLITNLGLGVLNRSAPQLNLFAVGFPVTLAVGFIILELALPKLPTCVARMTQESLEAALHVVNDLVH